VLVSSETKDTDISVVYKQVVHEIICVSTDRFHIACYHPSGRWVSRVKPSVVYKLAARGSNDGYQFSQASALALVGFTYRRVNSSNFRSLTSCLLQHPRPNCQFSSARKHTTSSDRRYPTRLHLVCWLFLYHISSTIILVFISSLCPIQVHSPLIVRNNQSCKVKQHVHFCHDPLGVCWACYNSAAMGGDHNTGLGPYLISS
jgi:hypothetical protein